MARRLSEVMKRNGCQYVASANSRYAQHPRSVCALGLIGRELGLRVSEFPDPGDLTLPEPVGDEWEDFRVASDVATLNDGGRVVDALDLGFEYFICDDLVVDEENLLIEDDAILLKS